MAEDAAFVTVLLDAARKAHAELSEPGEHERPGRDTFVQILHESLGVRDKDFFRALFDAGPDRKNLDPRGETLTMFNPGSVPNRTDLAIRCFNVDFRIDAAKLWRRILARTITSKPQTFFMECDEMTLRTHALSIFDELEGIVLSGRNRCRCICEDIIYALEHIDEDIVLVPPVIARDALSDTKPDVLH